MGGDERSFDGNGRRSKETGSWLGPALAVGGFAALLWLERRRPLRRAVEPPLRRDLRNLAIAAASAATLRVLERPVVGPLSQAVARRRWGLLPRLGLPLWAETMVAVLAMDYTLYVWHALTHRAAPLWRLHVVHHADLDLSATTAIRFHFLEMAASAPWRAAQVALIGVRPEPLRLWRNLLFASILFHHSNLRLPRRLERALVWIVVTPRMHGIHHSAALDETDSNWSSGLTLWDWLHGTLRLDVPQAEVRIGVPAFRAPAQVTLGRMLALPFGRAPETWRAPDGSHPVRRATSDEIFPGPDAQPATFER